MMSRSAMSLLGAALSLPLVTGCARKAPEIATVAPPAPAPVARAPMPRPPMRAATNLNIPAPDANGRYPTPNQNLSEAGHLWHLRSALNVAVLQCAKAGDPAETQYNAFLTRHRTRLSAAYATLEREYRGRHPGDWRDAFDDAMTRVYNFYAQPPARQAFCAAGLEAITAAATVEPAALSAHASQALAALDRPFTDFYRAYADYRVELAAWNAGGSAATPRLAVDPAILMADTQVTLGGTRVRYAGR